MGEYRTIVADPPWKYRTPGKFAAGDTSLFGSAGSTERYGAMSMAQLLDLAPGAADNAHLYLWTTNAFMVEAHELAVAWGFAPKIECARLAVHAVALTCHRARHARGGDALYGAVHS